MTSKKLDNAEKFALTVNVDSLLCRWLFFFIIINIIIAKGHVRASTGDLAVHGALIVCVYVRYQTPFSSRHESGQSLFLSTGTVRCIKIETNFVWE